MPSPDPSRPPTTADDPDRFREPGDEQSPTVCYCMHVHEATIRRAIAAGAGDLEALHEATRAGTGCGTCRVDLLVLLREAPAPPDQGGATARLLIPSALVLAAVCWLGVGFVAGDPPGRGDGGGAGADTAAAVGDRSAEPSRTTPPDAAGRSGNPVIRGQVVDGLDRPLDGCVVTVEPARTHGWLDDPASAGAVTVRSGADGRFSAALNAGGPLTVALRHPGFPPAVVATRLQSAPVRDHDLGRITLRSELGLEVGVRAARTGAPVEGARLVLQPALVDPALGPMVLASLDLAAVADRGGRALFYGVSPGLYRLRSEAAGYATVARTVERVASADGPGELRVDLPPGQVLRGRLVDAAGAAVAAAHFVARAHDSGLDTTVRSSEAGDFRIAGLTRGRYALWVQAPGLALHRDDVEVPLREPRLELELAPTRSLRGQIVDARSDDPVGGATVELEVRAPWVRRRPRALADPAGGFEIADLPPGRFEAVVSSEGFVTRRHGPFAPTGADGEPVVIRLEPACRVTGRVLDPAGRPLAAARIEIMPVSYDGTATARWVRRARPPRLWPPSVHSDADGRFALDVAPGGRARVRVRAPGHADRITPDIDLGSSGSRTHDMGDLVVPSGVVLSGRAERSGGQPAAGALVCADPVDDPPRASAQASADAEGRFAIGPLAPGPYDVFYYFPESATAAETADSRSATLVRIVLGEGTNFDLDLIVR